MELIDLTGCLINTDDVILKKKSLESFLELDKEYDSEKLCALLNVDIKTLNKWIFSFDKYNLKTNKEKVLMLKLKNPSMTQREIGHILGISAMTISRYLK